MKTLFLFLILPVAFSGEPAPKTCTYQVYNWNIYSKGPVNQARVAGHVNFSGVNWEAWA